VSGNGVAATETAAEEEVEVEDEDNVDDSTLPALAMHKKQTRLQTAACLNHIR